MEEKGLEKSTKSDEEFRKKTLAQLKKAIPNYKSHHLSAKETRFVAEYLSNGFNATQAYLSINAPGKYTVKTAGSQGAMLIATERIQAAIREWFVLFIGEKKEKLETEIIDTYYRRAFYPLTKFFDSYNEPLSIDQIPEEWHCCIDGIERRYYGKDADRETVIFKLANREKALDMLGKYMSIFHDTVKLDVTLNEDSQAKLSNIFNSVPRNVTPIPGDSTEDIYPHVSNE